MGELSAKTLAEMEAGARVLAQIAGDANLPPGYMDSLKAVHSRNELLRRWERDGKVTIETTKRLSVPMEGRSTHDWHSLYHVKCPNRDTVTFNDIPAERVGASPSELLIANIALALQAAGEL